MKWKNKNVLVTGAKGMIATELIEQLKKLDCKIYVSDIKYGQEHDLRFYNNALNQILIKEIRQIDYVFHLAGIKGNPKMTKERPVDFMAPMIQFDVNMILAAREHNVERFLYTSSIAVENPETDFYPAWAKLTAENLIEAIRIQGCKTKYCIVRPSNVYGKEDLSRDNLMVVSSLIKQGKQKGKLIMDIKGAEQTRDIISTKDVARGMIKAMEKMPQKPVNLCSGKETQIRDIARYIAHELNIPIEYRELNLVLGPDKKIMSNPYIKPKVSLQEGIKECCK